MRASRTLGIVAATPPDAMVDHGPVAGASTPVQLTRRPATPDSDTTAPITEEPLRQNVWRRTLRVRQLFADVVVLALIVMASVTIWPARLGGATSYVIVKGTSMEPKFHTGDLAVVRAQDTYHKGDIVAYEIPKGTPGGGHFVIHRIIGHSHGGFLMQGDNRKTPDSWFPKPHDILGRFRVLIPLPGMRFWSLFPWICCTLIGLSVIWVLWPKSILLDPPDAPTDASGDDNPLPGRAAPVTVGARRLRRLERDAILAEEQAERRAQRRSPRRKHQRAVSAGSPSA